MIPDRPTNPPSPEPLRPLELADCGAALCCGGLSRRMGVDKALCLAKPDGRLLSLHLAGELSERFGQTLLVTDDRGKFAVDAEFRRFAQAEDLIPRRGPAGAILTALTLMPGRPVFVLACDMPALDWDAVEALKELMAAGAEAALPRRGERPEPLFAFYGPAARPVFAQSLAEGRLAVRESLARLKTAFLDLPEGGFANLNRAEDVARAGLRLLAPA